VRGIAMTAALMLLATGSLILPGPASAQELSPRAYWPAPDGTSVLSLAYQYSRGDVVIDPTLPIEGVDARISVAQAAYTHTFGFLGRTSSLQLSLPYTWADAEGLYLGQPASRRIEGWADARLRFAINLIGAPTMNRQEFLALARNPVPQVGLSVLLQAPTGDYNNEYLINLGMNRWGVKPALGAIYPFAGTWAFEFEVGGWFFGVNDDFQGRRRLQNAILSSEAHLVKYLSRGIWASLDANFFTGGRTRVDGTLNRDLLRNSRMGATVVMPFGGKHALRASYSAGTMTESGGDYDVVSLVYIYLW
jgi:hypothetical protein